MYESEVHRSDKKRERTVGIEESLVQRNSEHNGIVSIGTEEQLVQRNSWHRGSVNKRNT